MQEIGLGDKTRVATDHSAGEDFAQLPRKQVVLTMTCVMLAMFLGALNQTIVVTAMPHITADLGGFDRYTWASTAYMLAIHSSSSNCGQIYRHIRAQNIFSSRHDNLCY